MISDERLAELIAGLDDAAQRFGDSEEVDVRCLLEELQQLREADRWLPVEEEVPYKGRLVILNIRGRVRPGWFRGKIERRKPLGTWEELGDGVLAPNTVTHWRPLPSAPKNESEKP